MSKMMALRKSKAAPGLTFEKVPIPKPGKDEILIKVKACSMCGTDIHIYNWDPPWSEGRMKPPKTLGHEVNGEVIEKGKNVKNLEIGDSISAESHIPDWTCSQCKMGNMHICENLKFFSIDVDGFFAPYAVMPATNAWKNPKNMKPEVATLQESMGNSVYTVYSAPIKNKNVAIFGLGPTGLFATAIAKKAGAAKVMTVGGTDIHRKIAKKVGATDVINRHEEDPVKTIMDMTNGKGADVVLEMSGAPSALQQALKVVRPTGHISVLGLPTKDVSLDVTKGIILKDVTFRGIYGRKIWDTWEITSRLLNEEKLDITPIITHKLKLEEYEKGLEAMKTGQCGKVVMFPK
jgi:threonine 3-dehydrogenase